VTDDEEGLTVWEAMQQFADPPPEDLKSDVQLFAGGITFVDEEYDERLRDPLLLGRLTDALRDGDWYAEGYEEPVKSQSEPVPVQTPLWHVLVLDETGAAEGGGLRYVGLRIYKTKPATPHLKEDVDAVYLKRVADMIAEKGRPPTVKEDEKWASRVFGSRDRARVFRRKHKTAEKRGTPKS